MKIIVDVNNVVLMYSENASPTPDDGCRLIELTDAQRTAFLALPDGRAGITFDGETFTAIPIELTAATSTRATISDGDLAQVLISRGLITQADVDAALRT